MGFPARFILSNDGGGALPLFLLAATFYVIYHKEIGPGHSRLPVDHRLFRRADLRSFRTAFGPPELAARRLCRRAQLAAAFARQARSSSGGERYAHSQHGCKVSRHPGDSGKDRPAWLGWPPVGPIRKYLSAAPVDVSKANISFRVLAFEAVARIG